MTIILDNQTNASRREIGPVLKSEIAKLANMEDEMTVVRKPRVIYKSMITHEEEIVEFDTTVEAHNHYLHLSKFYPTNKLRLDYGAVSYRE